MYEFILNELPSFSKLPISLSPQPSTGSGDVGSSLPLFTLNQEAISSAGLGSKHVQQDGNITSPLFTTSLEGDPVYSHPEFYKPSPSHITPSADLEHDELSSTPKPELKEKQPASKFAYYDNTAADELSNPSHQNNPHPISHDIPSVNVNLVAYDEP